jgi:hypothetical protein
LQVLRGLPNLTSLSIDQNRIRAEGAGALAAALAPSPLRSFTIAGNELGADGAAALGPIVQMRTCALRRGWCMTFAILIMFVRVYNVYNVQC